jgi:hypothetical protein
MGTPFNDAVQAAAATYSKEKWNSLTNAEQTKLIYDQIKIMDKMPLDKIRVSPEIEA